MGWSLVEVFFLKCLVDVGDEEVGFGEGGGGEAGEFFAVGVEKDDGGEAVDFVFLGVRFIFFRHFFVAFREVEFDEDVVFRGGFDEFLFGENVLPHGDAGWAPVGTSELDEDGFFLGFCLFEGLFEVGGPAFWSGGEGRGSEGDGGVGGKPSD